MIRQVMGFAAWSMMVAAALGCDPGLSPDDAKARCDQTKKADSQCVDDNAYEQCLSCQEECGDACLTLESCPLQFQCPK
jgi:hypothetical protein